MCREKLVEMKHLGIDLTRVLMKGENGGAKVFTLELIINMARLAKDIKFILFTSTNAHSEIKSLVKMFPNIKCQLAPQYRIGFLLRLFCRLLGKNTFMYNKKPILSFFLLLNVRNAMLTF